MEVAKDDERLCSLRVEAILPIVHQRRRRRRRDRIDSISGEEIERNSVSLLGFRFRFLMKQNNIVSLRHELRRQRRNNVLLLLIVFLYAISWLPFNIAYIFFTYANRFRRSGQVLRQTEDECQRELIVHCSFLQVIQFVVKKRANYRTICPYVSSSA